MGSIERNHRFFNQYIRSYVDGVAEWESYLKYFTFCYNISTNASLDDKFTPFELVFGKKATLPYDLTSRIDPIYNLDNFAKEAKFRLQTAHKMAQAIIEKSKIRNKIIYDKKSTKLHIKINDKVYIDKQPYDKRAQTNAGPFVIKSITEPNVELYDQKTNKTFCVHMNRIRI